MKKLLFALVAVSLLLGLFVSCSDEPTPNVVTVHFNLSGKGDNYDIVIENGVPSRALEDPVAAGFDFAGWYLDETCQEVWNLNSILSSRSEVTVYAKWVSQNVTVSFNLNGKGSAIEAQTIGKNAKATKPADPSETGFSFCGWYSDSALTSAFDFNNTVASSITIYAKWTPTGTISTEEQLKTAFSVGGIYTLESDIVFTTATDNSCLNLSAGTVLTLDLNGHVLDANENGRLIEAAGSLTITDSHPEAVHESYQTADADFPNGGVLYNGSLAYENGAGIKMTSGSLALNGGTIYKCSTTHNGGALYIGYATVSMEGAGFKNCSARNGGAIYVNMYGTLSANSVTSMDCSAIEKGGTIFYESCKESAVSNSSVKNSKASDGGAVYCDSDGGTITFRDTVFDGCSASSYGGAFMIYGTNVYIIGSTPENLELSIDASKESAESAASAASAAIMNSTAKVGGAIFTRDGSTLHVEGVSFFKCNATDRGGALFLESEKENSFANSIFMDCSAKTGGAISINLNGTLSANGITIRDCVASSVGGAIYSISSKDSTVSNSFVKDTKAANGGAAYCDDGIITFRDTIFDGCSASSYGGTFMVINATLNLIGTTAEDLENSIEASAAIKNSSALVGGAIFTKNNSSLYTDGVSFISCSATHDTNARGGALFLESVKVHSISNTIFRGCTSKTSGGAIASNVNIPSISIAGSQFIDCEATNGGAIMLENGSSMDVTSCVFRGDKASYGTIYSNNGALTVTDSDFIFSDTVPNKDSLPETPSYIDGGAIFVNGNTTTLRGVVIRNYIAKNSGGACYVKNGTLEICDSNTRNSEISNCATTYAASAAFGGGAIIICTNTTLVLEGNTAISNCFAFGIGGAINCLGTMTMKDSTSIRNCVAYKYETKYGYGGGITVAGSAVLLDDASITGCKAENLAPGIQLDTGKSLVVGGRVQIKDNYLLSNQKENIGIRMDGTVQGKTLLKFSSEQPLEEGACIYFYPVSIADYSNTTIVMTEECDISMKAFFRTHVTSHSIVEVQNAETGKYHLELQPVDPAE